MLQSRILQPSAVQLDFLKVGAFTLHCAMKGLAVRELQRPLWNQGCVQQVIALSGIGVETKHVEGEPRRHRPTVIIAWQPVGLVGIVLRDDLSHTV